MQHFLDGTRWMAPVELEAWVEVKCSQLESDGNQFTESKEAVSVRLG